MPTLDDLAAFLDTVMVADRLPGLDDPAGVWRASDRPVTTLGLSLEPWPGNGAWLAREEIDALFLHRPWRLDEHEVGDLGVLAYHLAFDEALSLGFSSRLAAALGMTGVEVLGRKEGRPIGMIGDVPQQGWDGIVEELAGTFGGLDRADPGGARSVGRVAVVGAMTPALVHEAARRGADAYVTGQSRVPARTAVEETGLGTVAVGHRRSELWGLRALAAALRERWPGLRLVLAPG